MCLLVSTWASLRSEKDRLNIESFRGFIEKFSLFPNRSEALISIEMRWTL